MLRFVKWNFNGLSGGKQQSIMWKELIDSYTLRCFPAPIYDWLVPKCKLEKRADFVRTAKPVELTNYATRTAFSRIRSTFRHVLSASQEINNKKAPKEMKSRRKSADETIKLKPKWFSNLGGWMADLHQQASQLNEMLISAIVLRGSNTTLPMLRTNKASN